MIKNTHIAIATIALMAATSPIAHASNASAGANVETTTEAETSFTEELGEAYDAFVAFTVEQRDEAVEAAQSAMSFIDVEIEERAEAVREGWADMSEDARALARQEMQDLRETRLALAEQFGALQAASAEAWDSVKEGFMNGYEELSDALAS